MKINYFMAKKGEHHEEASEKSSDDGKVGKFFANNYWMIATIVLALVLIGVLIFNSFDGAAGNIAIGKSITSFVQESMGVTPNITSIVEVNNGSLGKLYQVSGDIQGQEFQIYVSKGGDYLLSVTPLKVAATAAAKNTNTPTQTTVSKTDKPVSELFIWSYCPYGVTALTPFAEVAKLLGSSADFKVVLYYDGHGAHETQQNKIQACIQKYDKAKYWDYAIQFSSKIYTKCSGDAACDKTESTVIMKSLGIDSTKIFSCVASEGASLIAADSQRAQTLGVTGSPSLVVNGVIVNAARTADAYKTEICSAFNSAPAACGTTLSTAAGSTTGNC
jgi:hypothetical protein